MNDFLTPRFSGREMLVSPEHALQLEACIRGTLSHDLITHILASTVQANDDFWPQDDEDTWLTRVRPYSVVDGVLLIPVRGVLLHDFPYQLSSWATGYKYIERAFMRGLEDANVRGIALVIDSPGGEVAGCFDTVDRMADRSGEKPVRAFAAESAYSAAFAVACVADSITVTRTGGVGSVGVVTSHVDRSRAVEDAGYKITFIHAGAHKVDGNPYQALPESVRDRIQARIDELYAVFVASVAENRGITEDSVRATEALTYSPVEALAVGFADQIGALDTTLAEWSASLNPMLGDIPMSKTPEAAANEAAATETLISDARATGEAQGRTDGATAERDRISAILTDDAAEGRSAAALNIALKTDLPAEKAVTLLSTLPKEAAAATATTASAFDTAMATGNPEISPEAAADGRSQAEIHAARILAAGGR